MTAWRVLQAGDPAEMDGHKYTPDMVLGPARKGLKMTYCTDTRPTDSIARIAASTTNCGTLDFML